MMRKSSILQKTIERKKARIKQKYHFFCHNNIIYSHCELSDCVPSVKNSKHFDSLRLKRIQEPELFLRLFFFNFRVCDKRNFLIIIFKVHTQNNCLHPLFLTVTTELVCFGLLIPSELPTSNRYFRHPVRTFVHCCKRIYVLTMTMRRREHVKHAL